MRRSDHTLRRGCVWYWRRGIRTRIPVEQGQVSSSEGCAAGRRWIKLSLSTESRREAVARARILDLVFEDLAGMPSTSPTLLDRILIQVRDTLLVQLETARRARAPDAPTVPPRDSVGELSDEFVARLAPFLTTAEVGAELPADLAAALCRETAALPRPKPQLPSATEAAQQRGARSLARAALMRQASRSNDLTSGAPMAEAAATALGVVVPPDLRPHAAAAALLGAEQAYQVDADVERGDATARAAVLRLASAPPPPSTASQAAAITQPELSETLPEPASQQQASSASAVPAPTSPGQPKRPDVCVTAAMAARNADPAHGARLTSKTQRDGDLAARLFAELVGDLPVSQIQYEHVDQYRRELHRIPAGHGRASEFRNLTVREAIARADLLDGQIACGELDPAKMSIVRRSGKQWRVERVSAATVNKHLSAVNQAWKHAMKCVDRGAVSPFTGEFHSKSERKKDQRLFRSSLAPMIPALFASPLYQGNLGDRVRARPGDVVAKDAKYWAPLIAIFAGARMEEILQLNTSDILEEDGHWVVVFNASEEQRSKTNHSRRMVPLHPSLIELGLIDHVMEMRRRQQRRLFPELTAGGIDGTFSYAFSKWWTEFRRDAGLYVEGKDFHAARGTVVTILKRRKVAHELVQQIVGHDQKGVTNEHYFHGYQLDDLAEAIRHIDFDISPLKR